MATRMEHANLHVRHFDEAVRFLTAAFPDFRVRSEETREGGLRWMHIGTDETYIALNETRDDAPGHAPYSGSAGVNHLGYEVDDVDALRARLSAAGFRDSTYPNSHPHRKRVYFYDADGNDWEFVQYFTEDRALRNDYELPDD